MTSNEKPFKRGNTFIKYTVLRLIGQGGFSYIYHVKDKDSSEKYALKVESKSATKPKLQNEIEILSNIYASPFFPNLIDHGETQNYNYYVMELLGPNLTTVRKKLPDQKYSLTSVLLLSVHMLRCIKQFHLCGYVHRDIKPANFLVKKSREYPISLIDYGLSRLHIKTTRHPFEYISDDENNNNGDENENRSDKELVPPRSRTGFVGTLRYCSLTSHEGNELGRKDDLISWFFSVVELFSGKLPWGDDSDREVVKSKKMEYCSLTTDTTHDENQPEFVIDQEGKPYLKLCKDMPSEFTSIWNILKDYKYEDRPDYNLILSLLNRAIKKNKISFGDKLDWETKLGQVEKETISLIPIDPVYDYKFYSPDKKDIVPINDDEEKHGCKCLLI